MIYSVENGDRGDVFADGVEINCVVRIDTGTGEILKHVEPLRVEDGEVVTETIIAKNIVFKPLQKAEKEPSGYELPENPTPSDFMKLLQG